MKRFFLLLLTVALLLTTAACQKPDADALEAESNTQRLLQTASQAKDTNIVASAAALLRERLGAKEHLIQKFSSANGTKSVSIDADVIIPQASKLSVVEVRRGELTQELADRVINALVVPNPRSNGSTTNLP